MCKWNNKEHIVQCLCSITHFISGGLMLRGLHSCVQILFALWTLIVRFLVTTFIQFFVAYLYMYMYEPVNTYICVLGFYESLHIILRLLSFRLQFRIKSSVFIGAMVPWEISSRLNKKFEHKVVINILTIF